MHPHARASGDADGAPGWTPRWMVTVAPSATRNRSTPGVRPAPAPRAPGLVRAGHALPEGGRGALGSAPAVEDVRSDLDRLGESSPPNRAGSRWCGNGSRTRPARTRCRRAPLPPPAARGTMPRSRGRLVDPSQVKLNWQPVRRSDPLIHDAHTLRGKAGGGRGSAPPAPPRAAPSSDSERAS
jgi:hypothetical protein